MFKRGPRGPRADLSEMIVYVADQLRQASAKSTAHGNAIMQLSQCDVELTVEVDKNGSAGVQVWVVDINAGASKNVTHKVTVTFIPIPGQPATEFLAEVKTPKDFLVSPGSPTPAASD